jgi:uncharacterized membrane protein
VLLSGCTAVLYFTTYAASVMYGLFPIPLAFALMVGFTCFTVLAALHYNRQVIAHVGMVGAYAVPFLLDTGSGRVGLLFSYMALINSGIAIIAFLRYWKSLHYTSFVFTWITVAGWILFGGYRSEDHWVLALGFVSLFFAIFYVAFMS